MQDYANTYAQMTDEELMSLALELESLTESARTPLRIELRKRRLGEDEIRSYQQELEDAERPPQVDKEEPPGELGARVQDYESTYAQMTDEELMSLALVLDSLTLGVRNPLRIELRKRGLGEDEIRAHQQELEEAGRLPETEITGELVTEELNEDEPEEVNEDEGLDTLAEALEPNRLHPLTTPSLLGRTLYLFRRHTGLFAGIAAPPVVLVVVLVLLTARMPGYPSGGQLDSHLWQETSSWARATFMVSLLVLTVLIALAFKASVLAAADLHLGRSAGVLQSYARSRGKHIFFFWLLLIALGMPGTGSSGISWHLVIGLGMPGTVHRLLIIISQVVIALWIAPAIPVALLEERSPVDAIKRSQALTKGTVGRLLLIQLFWLVLFLIALLIIVFLSYRYIWYISEMSSDTLAFLGELGFSLAALFALQCWAIALTVSYFDQRARKENWSPSSAS